MRRDVCQRCIIDVAITRKTRTRTPTTADRARREFPRILRKGKEKRGYIRDAQARKSAISF